MYLSGSVLDFTRGMFEYVNKTPYIVGEHHIRICRALDEVVKGSIRKLIINIAPRYGKTQLASIMFIAYGLAINPESKFIHLSYSGQLTQDNSVAVKDVLNSEYFKAVFDTRVKFGSDTKAKWDTEQGGGLYATSTLGQITGFGAGKTDKENEVDDSFAGAIVIDDPLKPEDALSDNIREQVNRRFETTIRNRVNSRRTPIIIIMQRLHEHDLCGYLQEAEPEEWTVLSLPCIIQENNEERALWPHKHSLEELHKLEKISPFVFETQYMQNPTPMEGFMYTRLRTYTALPLDSSIAKNYTDTADTGADFHCSICYQEYSFGMYITDVLYTERPVEYTEVETAKLLANNKTEIAYVESNNGGRVIAKNIERNLRLLGVDKTSIIPFSQNASKDVRIFSHSAEVQNLIFFPEDWKTRWPQFYKDVTSFRKEGRNAHDDAPDVLTGMTEKFRSDASILSNAEIVDDFS